MFMNTYLTQERYEELKEELNGLKTKGRKQVAEKLKQAKELGDLSENAEYQEAREEQMRLEQKIAQLEEVLRNFSIIKKTSASDAVRVGSKVSVKRNGETISYTIMGSSEADPTQNLISNESPIGRALLEKKVGDVVYVETPKGRVSYEILSIE